MALKKADANFDLCPACQKVASKLGVRIVSIAGKN